MHFHKQNLNEKPDGTTGWMFREGRCWLYVGRSTTYLSWLFGSGQHHLHFHIDWHDEDGYGVSIAIPFLFAVWLFFKHPRLPRFEVWDWTIFNFTIHEEYIWFDVWNSDNEYPRPRHISLNWKSLLFGESVFKQIDLKQERTSITLIDGEFPCTATLQLCEWSRPRQPWKIKRTYVDIEPEQPVPIPGKGENSWDMDDDAIWSMSICADTIPDGIQKFREHVIKRRERYGGKHWKPDNQ